MYIYTSKLNKIPLFSKTPAISRIIKYLIYRLKH